MNVGYDESNIDDASVPQAQARFLREVTNGEGAMPTGRRRASIVLGLVLSAVFLVLFMNDIEWVALGNALRRAEIRYVVVAAVIHFAALVFKVWRWQILLTPLVRIRFPVVFSAHLIGMTGNCLLPARIGDMIRAWLIGIKARIKFTAAFATVVLEKTMEVLGFLLAFVLALPFLPKQMGEMRNGVIWLAVFAVGVCACLFSMAAFAAQWQRMIRRVACVLPERIANPLIGLAGSFFSGFRVALEVKRLGQAVVVSIAILLIMALSMYTLFFAFELEVSFIGALFVLFALGIAIFVPQAPGFIGVFHWATKEGLEIMAVDPSSAAAYAIACWAIFIIPPIFVGLVCLSREGLSLGELPRQATREQAPR